MWHSFFAFALTLCTSEQNSQVLRITLAIFGGKDDKNTSRPSGTRIGISGNMLVKQRQLAKLTSPILKSLHDLNLRPGDYVVYRCFARLGRSDLVMPDVRPTEDMAFRINNHGLP